MRKLALTLTLASLLLGGCGALTPAEPTPTPTPYPDEIPWELAVELLQRGEVQGVFQAHSLEVTFDLKNGQRVKTVEPRIDAIFDELAKCGQPCAEIIPATE